MPQSGLYATYIVHGTGSSILGQTPMGAGHTSLSGTAAQHRVTDRSTPGDLKNFYANVTVNSNPNSVTVAARVNGAVGNLSITVPASTTGLLSDLTGTDAVADGDTFNHTVSIGASGAAFEVICGVQYETTGQFAFQPAGGASAGSTLSTASTTYYSATAGRLNQNTNATVGRLSAIGSTTISKLQLYVSANGRSTDTTVVSRNNGADGNQTVTIAAGATGLFEDTTNTDTVSDGDYYQVRMTTGTGSGNFTTRYMSYRIETSADSWCPLYANAQAVVVNASTTVQRGFVDTARAGATPIPYAAHASQLFISVASSTISAASTITLRINGSGSALVATIPASSTGRFIDTTNVVALAAGDLVDVEITGGASGTNMTVRDWGVLICANKTVATTDTLLPKTDEVSTNLLATERTDTLLPKIDEASASQLLLALTEALLPRLDEAAAGFGTVAATDTLLPKTDEVSTNLLATERTDTLLPKIDEVSTNLLPVALSDALLPLVTETAGLLSLLERADELLVLLTELSDIVAGSTVTEVDVTDTLLPKIAETLEVLAQLAREDTLLPKLTETAGLLAYVATSDTLLPMVTEALDALVVLSRTDALTPKLTEAITLLSLLSRADTLLPLITDIVTVQSSLAVTDTLLPKTVEAATLAQTLHLLVTDTLAPQLTELSTIVSTLARAVAAGVDIRPLLTAFPALGPLVDAAEITVDPRVVADPSVGPRVSEGGTTISPKVDAAPTIGAYSGHGPRGRR